MTILLLACQKHSKESPTLAWKHRPYRDGRRQIEVYYSVANAEVPTGYDEDKRCHWVASSRAVTAYTCPEFGKVWRAQANLGTGFIDHDNGGLMFTERPAPSLQSKLAALQPPASVLPPTVNVPSNEHATWPLGLRLAVDGLNKGYQEKLKEEALRHANANGKIEREHRQEMRELMADWGRRVQ